VSTGSTDLAGALGLAALTGPRRALAEEAVRIKRRLDELDAFLTGDPAAWHDIALQLGGEVAEVTVRAPMVEARQHALALATVLDKLGVLTREQVPAAPPVDPADELKEARERRQREAAARAAGTAD